MGVAISRKEVQFFLYLQVTNTGFCALHGHQTAGMWLQAVKVATLFCGIQTADSKLDGPCQGTRSGSQHSAGSHITSEYNQGRMPHIMD
jgi:hypothetical protein